MSLPILTSKTIWAIAGAVVFLSGTTWLIFGRGSADAHAGVPVPAEYSKESLKAKAAEGSAGFGAMREAMQREDLTEEQRRQIAQNAREVWRERMDAQVTEYFNAPTEEEKVAILDRQIDQMQEQMKGSEERRKEWEKQRQERRAGEQGPPRGPFGPQSQQERKERSESRNPDQTARTMAYFSALRERASSRGIPLPAGPGGPGGGMRRGGP